MAINGTRNLLPEIVSRRSVRRFDSRPVDRETIRLCLEAARLAPSAENVQPWRFIVLDDPEAIRRFADKAFSGLYAVSRWAASAPVLIVLGADLDILANRLGRFLTGIPYYLLDIGIAGEHLVFQAMHLGLGTCWIGWLNPKKARETLGLPKSIRVCGVIAMGYPCPEEKPRPLRRKPLEEIVHWNGWRKEEENSLSKIKKRGPKKRRPWWFFLFLLMVICLAGLARSQSVAVPIGHRIYDFFERMEARSLLSSFGNNTRPYSRLECARRLALLDSLARCSPSRFTRVDLQWLERFKGEFWEEPPLWDVPISAKEKEPHLYRGRLGEAAVAVDALFGGEILWRDSHADPAEREVYRPYYGVRFRGADDRFGLSLDTRIFSEWGSRKYISRYRPSLGYPIGAERDSSRATWDVSEGHLTGRLVGIDFLWGRERIAWGPARIGLTFSGMSYGFDLFSVRIRRGPALLTFVHGELRSDFSHRWIAAHRLELLIWRQCLLGIHEAVVYGRRGIELAYLYPFLPYLTVQHTLGDRDNMTMGFDFSWTPRSGFKVYGDVFIDDLFAPWEVFSDYYGNKLAFTFGLFLTDPLGLRDMDWRFEYTRIDPYVYTHADSANVYEHYDQGVGSDLQPNSDRFRIDVIHRLSFSYEINGFGEMVRHGPGDRRISDRSRIDDGKHFLRGPVEKISRIGVGLRYEPVRDLRFTGKVIRISRGHPAFFSPSSGIELYFQVAWDW